MLLFDWSVGFPMSDTSCSIECNQTLPLGWACLARETITNILSTELPFFFTFSNHLVTLHLRLVTLHLRLVTHLNLKVCHKLSTLYKTQAYIKTFSITSSCILCLFFLSLSLYIYLISYSSSSTLCRGISRGISSSP